MQWSCLKLPWGAWRFWGPPKWQISTGFGGLDFLGAKKTFFGGYQKLKTIFGYSRSRKKNFRLLQKTLAYTKQPLTCWKLQHIENAVSLLTTRFLWLYQTSMYLPGTHGSLNVKHPRRQYRETPLQTRTRRFLFILYVSLYVHYSWVNNWVSQCKQYKNYDKTKACNSMHATRESMKNDSFIASCSPQK